MKKLLFSSLILLSAQHAFSVRGAAPIAIAPTVATAATVKPQAQNTLANQIEQILAQIKPGISALAQRKECVEDAFKTLESGLINADLTGLDQNTKDCLIASCDAIYEATNTLILEYDKGVLPYWVKSARIQPVKDLLVLQDKINNRKEQISGPSVYKMLISPLKHNKGKTATCIATLYVLHMAGTFTHGLPFVVKNAGAFKTIGTALIKPIPYYFQTTN